MTRVDRCPDVDDSSFDDVLAHYQADIYRFALHLTRDRAEADDLYQETMLTAFHAFRDRPANFRSWLFTIAASTFLSDQGQRGPRGSPGKEQATKVHGAPPDHPVRLDAHTLRHEVEACVATLPRQQWAALVQRTYFDREYVEIAETLGCSELVARTCVYEALRAMRVHIGDRL